ncbi:hypothetical protein GCM10022223_17310 [Kineosporia mesophila]|uniref:Uncharacterized protein n=1 Tax=Kineosporia mesophila TaxID=566012 RepID=A0ABP6ZAJ1_9ACTN
MNAPGTEDVGADSSDAPWSEATDDRCVDAVAEVARALAEEGDVGASGILSVDAGRRAGEEVVLSSRVVVECAGRRRPARWTDVADAGGLTGGAGKEDRSGPRTSARSAGEVAAPSCCVVGAGRGRLTRWTGVAEDDAGPVAGVVEEWSWAGRRASARWTGDSAGPLSWTAVVWGGAGRRTPMRWPGSAEEGGVVGVWGWAGWRTSTRCTGAPGEIAGPVAGEKFGNSRRAPAGWMDGAEEAPWAVVEVDAGGRLLGAL